MGELTIELVNGRFRSVLVVDAGVRLTSQDSSTDLCALLRSAAIEAAAMAAPVKSSLDRAFERATADVDAKCPRETEPAPADDSLVPTLRLSISLKKPAANFDAADWRALEIV